MTQFQAAIDFYRGVTPLILASGRNEWAVDTHSWDGVIAMTPIESAIWERIRDLQAVFYPQYPVDRFFPDFANPIAKVAIECDGLEFHKDRDKDVERDDVLRNQGWVVYRIPGRLCITESDEETGLESFATRMIRAIAETHGLIRGLHKTRGIDEVMTEYLRYSREGKLALIGIVN